MVAVVPFDDEADAIRIANDTRVRPVRLDLDPGRRAGAAGQPRQSRPATCPVNSHSSVRYWTPFGGFKSVRTRPRAWPDAPLAAFTETKNVFISTQPSRRELTWQAHSARLQGKVAVVTGARQRDRHSRPFGGSPPKAPRWWSPTSTPRPGAGRRRGWTVSSSASDVADRAGRCGRLFAARTSTSSAASDVAFNNAGISPARRRLDPDHRRRRVAAGCRRST